MPANETSLFEKYGGFTTVSTLVKEFYDQVLESDNLSPYFENKDMDALIKHQTQFLSHLLGGPAQYAGRTLATAHKGLNISEESFDEVATILSEVLEDGGVEQEDLDAIMAIVAQTKADIVEKPQ